MLHQDIERKSGDADAHADDGVSLRDGVSKDRMVSVHDPELRHGHKSSRRRFNGHKAAIVVDTDSQLITAVDVLPGKAPDNLGALELVEQSEASTDSVVQEAMGDAAYGDGGTRQTFADAGRQLVAKVPGRPNRSHFPKDDFHLDLAAGIIVQVKSGHVNRGMIATLKGDMEREKTDIGVFITLQPPTEPMRQEALSAGIYTPEHFPDQQHPRLQILTIDDLFAGQGMRQEALAYPRGGAPATFRQAPRRRRSQGQQSSLV